MQTVIRFLNSPIGRKVMMALTGLLLVGFLVAHLGTNLLIFKGDDSMNSASHALVSNPLIIIAELGLVFLFGYHAVNGIALVLKNRAARPDGYQSKRDAGGRSRRSLASKLMPLTGTLLFVFLVVHIATMKFGDGFDGFLPNQACSVDESKDRAALTQSTADAEAAAQVQAGAPVQAPAAACPSGTYCLDGHCTRDLKSEVVKKFEQPLWAFGYILAMLILGFHLWHGVFSAFETLGARHNKGLMRAGQVIAITFMVGFSLIPLLILAGFS